MHSENKASATKQIEQAAAHYEQRTERWQRPDPARSPGEPRILFLKSTETHIIK